MLQMATSVNFLRACTAARTTGCRLRRHRRRPPRRSSRRRGGRRSCLRDRARGRRACAASSSTNCCTACDRGPQRAPWPRARAHGLRVRAARSTRSARPSSGTRRTEASFAARRAGRTSFTVFSSAACSARPSRTARHMSSPRLRDRVLFGRVCVEIEDARRSCRRRRRSACICRGRSRGADRCRSWRVDRARRRARGDARAPKISGTRLTLRSSALGGRPTRSRSVGARSIALTGASILRGAAPGTTKKNGTRTRLSHSSKPWLYCPCSPKASP